MTTDNDFIARANAELAELKERRLELQNRQAQLDHDWSVLADEEAVVQNSISFYRRVMGVGDPATAYGDLKAMTILNACEAILKAHGGEADAPVMVAALQEAGKLQPGKNAYNIMATQLYRSRDRFHRVGRGRWALGPAPDVGEGNVASGTSALSFHSDVMDRLATGNYPAVARSPVDSSEER
jgi:hypothetical protein